MATQTYEYDMNEGSLRAIKLFFLADSRKKADSRVEDFRKSERDRLAFVAVRSKSFIETLAARRRVVTPALVDGQSGKWLDRRGTS